MIGGVLLGSVGVDVGGGLEGGWGDAGGDGGEGGGGERRVGLRLRGMCGCLDGDPGC